MTSKVLVVGSGPAGMSAAFFISLKEGFEVTVLERLGDIQYARYHEICGGGISRKAFGELRPMMPSGVLNDIESTRIVWPDGTEVKMRTVGYILDRPKFLSDLKDQCIGRGVRFVRGTAVSASEDGEGYVVKTSSGNELRCDWLIGADGACSVIRRDIFKSVPKARVPATECIIEGHQEGDLIIRLSDDGSGTYTWSFPRGDNTGTGGMKGYSEDGCLMKGSRFIPFGGVGDIAKGHALLVGDAAAMANPVSYGGLKAALLSGKKAAGSMEKDDPSGYQKWWDSSILSDRRFMDFNTKLKGWSAEEMNKAVRPFRHGGIYLPGMWACMTQPKNVNMYFGCLFAFRHGW